jgi:hypothetical protein
MSAKRYACAPASLRIILGVEAPSLELPICAVCDRPVDELRYYDELGGVFGVRIITARCHGEEESVRLGMEEFRAMASADGKFRFGKAFATKRLNP